MLRNDLFSFFDQLWEAVQQGDFNSPVIDEFYCTTEKII